jgi:uncharacterized protein (TIRG00374 family)
MIKEDGQMVEQSTINGSAKNSKAVFRKDTIIKGSLWFALITIITIAAIFFYNNTGNAIQALKSIKPKYILLCFIMLFIDLMLGSWRNHIFVRKLKPGLSHWVSFKANVANMFMGAVTPAHGGAGPAQIYVYMSNGVSFIDAFAVSLINMGATLIFMPLAGLLAIFLMNKEYVGGIVPSLLRYGFSFFTLFLFAFLLAFLKPLLVGSLLKRISEFLAGIFKKQKERLLFWGERSVTNIAKYQESCSILLKKHPLLFPLALLITTVLYLNKYVLQYVILLGLGVDADIVQVISIQILIQFMIYFAPSPGGSGFAEISISVLFGKVVPPAVLPMFTLLQRSFLLFFPALVGAYLVIGLLRKQTQKASQIIIPK